MEHPKETLGAGSALADLALRTLAGEDGLPPAASLGTAVSASLGVFADPASFETADISDDALESVLVLFAIVIERSFAAAIDLGVFLDNSFAPRASTSHLGFPTGAVSDDTLFSGCAAAEEVSARTSGCPN